MSVNRMIALLTALTPEESARLALAAAKHAGMSPASLAAFERALEVGVDYREMQRQVRAT